MVRKYLKEEKLKTFSLNIKEKQVKPLKVRAELVLGDKIFDVQEFEFRPAGYHTLVFGDGRLGSRVEVRFNFSG